MTNTLVTLENRPSGAVKVSDFGLKTEKVRELKNGEFLVNIEALSMDPAIRGWMNPGTTYIKGVELGTVMRSFSAGKVIDSKNDSFKVGVYVEGLLGAQTHAITDGTGIRIINVENSKLTHHLGVLGMPGMTAYFGLLRRGEPKPGEVIYVSAASGVVGSTVGQIAKIKGCTVIGSAGSEAKCKYLIDECGFDHAINYKTEDLDAKLKEYAPDGVHIFYDNVGGDTLNTALANLAQGARVVICGAISQYNDMGNIQGPANYMKIVTARGYMTGIIVFDFIKEWPAATKEIAGWIAEGKIHVKEDVVHGLENYTETLMMLFTGKNFGKLILTV
ncbi:NADP-dependent oxidoreductase [Costertonia aggregata]|uniref:NADP-dependent oxidoreductase n=1 Tax=Costertonia aggregata TaxID=343403 RepID=A0A7H9ANQ1_9FLAO|nr:NADP-dependent oxidoreductase [Costertonia aggregata]QLG45060.1 NADP-dependent oxidoreductase [Costertonia aggregata]